MVKEYIVKVTDEVSPDAFERFESAYAPEQLIRCRDCYWYNRDELSRWTCGVLHLQSSPDWFCAGAKKRIGGIA